MTEYKAQQFTVEPDPGDPAAELSLRKIDQFMIPVAQIAFGNDSNTYLSFQSNPGGAMAEQMRIHINGNIGIGTASPGEKLEVVGTVKATAFDGNLNGSQITTGTIVDTRLPLSVSRTADVDARFDPSTGHKHTGTAGDGSQISHGTLTAIIGADPGSTDAQTNKHVSNAQTKQWQDHLGVTSGNPHGTTAAQVGSPVSVEGVTNPGGNIDLVNSNAITIAGNNTTKQITIGETHSTRTDNPHSTTAVQVGALTSVDGVSNAGGNVDLVNSNAITISGNNTTKQITIGETHSARTDNPHNTTATQLGALASVDGVSNAGGNVDLVNSNAITITGDNTTKQITIGETHSTRTDNPHSTTASQVGALISVDGVSNGGGNIDLVNSDAITITGDNVTKQITIGESHSALTSNPHATTAAQVGALASMDGVSYPGGNIDLLQGNMIVITPDNINKRITIGESHSTLTNNPHNVTAGQLGALLETNYDLKRTSVASAYFYSTDASGATRTIATNFEPKLFIVSGGSYASLGGRNHGQSFSSFANLRGTIQRYCSSFYIYKYSATDWCQSASSGNYLYLATYYDGTVSPSKYELLYVDIFSVTTTNFVIRLQRTVQSGYAALNSFYIALNILYMG